MDKHQGVDWSALHTVEEMRQLSNLGHWIEGALFGLIGIIALLQALGTIKNSMVLWQSIVLAAGIFLISYLLLHHGIAKVPLVWSLVLKDPQQRQHLLIALLMSLAGLAQILSKIKMIQALHYGWPLALLAIGVLFLVHEQHGSSEAIEWAQRIHRYLGILLILVSLAFTLNTFFANRYRWFSIGWPVLLILCAVFLMLYREPPGAFEDHNTHINHIKH